MMMHDYLTFVMECDTYFKVQEKVQMILENKMKTISRSKWGSNKWTRGSYSFRSIKTDNMNVWAEDLSEPVTNIQGKPVSKITLLFDIIIIQDK